jgi:NDP-sugar pyrophosphorylase family protein
MCTGHLADQIEQRFADGSRWNLAIQYSQEPRPLGTAGAIKLAQHYLEGYSDFVVMNGDSFLEIDFQRLIRFHHAHGGLVSIAIRSVQNAARYGTVHTNESNRITAFDEKRGLEEPGLISSGVYVIKRTVLEHIPDGPASLETDVFPRLLKEGMFALKQDGIFIDIGTPEDYARAQTLCRDLQQAADLGSR